MSTTPAVCLGRGHNIRLAPPEPPGPLRMPSDMSTAGAAGIGRQSEAGTGLKWEGATGVMQRQERGWGSGQGYGGCSGNRGAVQGRGKGKDSDTSGKHSRRERQKAAPGEWPGGAGAAQARERRPRPPHRHVGPAAVSARHARSPAPSHRPWPGPGPAPSPAAASRAPAPFSPAPLPAPRRHRRLLPARLLPGTGTATSACVPSPGPCAQPRAARTSLAAPGMGRGRCRGTHSQAGGRGGCPPPTGDAPFSLIAATSPARGCRDSPWYPCGASRHRGQAGRGTALTGINIAPASGGCPYAPGSSQRRRSSRQAPPSLLLPSQVRPRWAAPYHRAKGDSDTGRDDTPHLY